MVLGAVLYLTGLMLLAAAHLLLGIMIGAGVLIGGSLACTAAAMSVAARAVPESVRSTVLGIVAAAGSLGALLSAPDWAGAQRGFGWRFGAGRVDRGKYPPAEPGALEVEPLKAALTDHAHYTHSMTDGLGPISSRAFARARMGPIHYVCTL
jgi:hypothetical protein